MSKQSTFLIDSTAPAATTANASQGPLLEAVRLAAQARFDTAPNPCVGAVLTIDGKIVAQGWHQAAGRPHAEVEAIADARAKSVEVARATLWVTLEPCNHHGKTPPCTEAILQARIPEVVIGCLDPNPDVAGGGAARLREQGVTVREAATEQARQACQDLLADFLVWKTEQRPYVVLKLASTLDGRIATRTGHSRWVSGRESRSRVHTLRSHVQAVLIGGNTFREDDPSLDCRLDGADPQRQPLAVICGSRLPELSAVLPCLLQRRPEQTFFWTSQEAAASTSADRLRSLGCRIVGLPSGKKHGLDLRTGLQALYSEHNCAYVLCEGGGSLGLSLLEAGLCDELHLFQAPKILGDDKARPLFAGRSPELMNQALHMRITDVEQIGQDVLLVLRRNE